MTIDKNDYKINSVENLIVSHLAGSHAYGMSTPESDVDVRGIFCGTQENIRTPWFPCREQTIQGMEDAKVYELTNFMKLYLDCNPNIIESLWVDDDAIIQKTPVYDLLVAHRKELLCSKVAFTFSGYAMSQLKRIKGHNKFINNPKTVEPPRQTSFVRMVQNLSDEKIMPRDFHLEKYRKGRLIPYEGNLYGLYLGQKGQQYETFSDDYTLNTIFDNESRAEWGAPDILVKFNKDEYLQENDDHRNYWTWKKNRNKKRSAIEEAHGYDCYSDDTEFLTATGWKMYDEILKEDRLATFNGEHKVVYQNFYERFESKYTGNMYHFKGCHQDTLVTANHRMYIKDYARNLDTDMSEWRLESASNLKETYKILNTISPKVNMQKLPEGCYKGDLDLKDYLRLMGWLISDGTFMFREGKPRAVRITQSKPQSRLTQTMTKMRNNGVYKCSHGLYEKSDGGFPENVWIFHGSVTQSLFEDCGHGSKNKRIPNWVFGLTKRMMSVLLTAMIQGDGTKRNQKDTYVYYSSNKNLASDVQRLAFLCGYETSLWGPYSYEGNSFGDCDMYQVHINKNPAKERVNKGSNLSISPVQDKRVVCFSVPNSTLITRRNGKISLHGNCKHASHLVRLLRMGGEVLTTGEVIVKRPDAQELLNIRNGEYTYDEILSMAQGKDELIRGELYKNTCLRKTPDVKLAAKVLMQAQDMLWG